MPSTAGEHLPVLWALRRLAIVVCLILAPVCVWVFQRANASNLPWEKVRAVVGPPRDLGSASAPPYLEWDIAAMLVTAVVGSLAVICLLMELVLALRSRWRR